MNISFLSRNSRAGIAIPARLRLGKAAGRVAIAASLVGCVEYPSQLDNRARDSIPPGLHPPPSSAVGPIPDDAPPSFTGAMGAVDGKASHLRKLLTTLPAGLTVWYTVTGSGILDGEWEPHPSHVTFGDTVLDLSVTGAFEGITCKGASKINGSGFRGGCPSDSSRLVSVDTFKLWDSVWLSRDDGPTATSMGAPVTSTWRCSYPNCRVYTGTQEFAFIRIPATMTLLATMYGSSNPLPAQVRWQSYGHFWPGIMPSQLPFKVLGWTWLPIVSSVPPRTPDCTPGANPCTIWFKESGYIELTGYANGKKQTERKLVTVLRRRLTLNPEEAYVAAGDTVRWTAGVDTAGGTASGWKWSVVGDTVGLFKSTTCTSAALTCHDVPKRDYIRMIEATVDDSLQRKTANVTVGVCTGSLYADSEMCKKLEAAIRTLMKHPVDWCAALGDSANTRFLDGNFRPADPPPDRRRLAMWSLGDSLTGANTTPEVYYKRNYFADPRRPWSLERLNETAGLLAHEELHFVKQTAKHDKVTGDIDDSRTICAGQATSL